MSGPAGRVVLVRGRGSVWSRGLGVLCDRLRRAGLHAEDWLCLTSGGAFASLHTHHGPIALVGHSCGGRAILRIADRLGTVGVAVNLVVCLDVALPRPVSANVRRAVHYYIGGWRLYPARPLTAVGGTEVVNCDIRTWPAGTFSRRPSHLTITDSLTIQDAVSHDVTAALTCPTPG